MEEVNLGTVEEPKITYISSLISTNLKEHIISLLKEFKDCFAWNYDEMTGLGRVCHIPNPRLGGWRGCETILGLFTCFLDIGRSKSYNLIKISYTKQNYHCSGVYSVNTYSLESHLHIHIQKLYIYIYIIRAQNLL